MQQFGVWVHQSLIIRFFMVIQSIRYTSANLGLFFHIRSYFILQSQFICLNLDIYQNLSLKIWNLFSSYYLFGNLVSLFLICIMGSLDF